MPRCPAMKDDFIYCEDVKGHSGPHWFTSTVEWEGCWSCQREPYEEHENGYCEAVQEALEVWTVGLEYPEEAGS